MWHQTIKDGKVRYFERYKDADGNTKTASVTYKAHNARNEKAALAQLTRIISERSQASGKNMTFAELCEMYLDAQRDQLKPSTFRTTSIIVGHLVDLVGKMDSNGISAGDIQKAVLASDLKPCTQGVCLRRFKTVMFWAYRMDFVTDVQFLQKVQVAKTRGKDPTLKYLEDDEIDVMRANLSGEFLDLFDFALLTGCRIGEIASLRVEDVDLISRTIHIHRTYDFVHLTDTDTPKTEASNRYIYIQEQLMPLCERLTHGANKADLLFRPRIKRETIRRRLRAASNGLVSKIVTPHMLRHTHCSLLAAAGIPLEQISRRLGHDNSEVTRSIYLHVTEKAKARENERLDKLKLF